MFDAVGRSLDPEATRRTGTSLLLTAGVMGVVAGVLGALSFAMVHGTEALPTPPPEPMVELMPLNSNVAELALPSAPRLGGGTSEALPEPVPEPTEPDPKATLTPAVDPSVVLAKPTGGPPGPGTPEGHPEGSGRGDGDCIGPHCQGIADPHERLETRKRVEPRFPKEAKQRGLSGARCLATISIDERGVPYDVIVQDCPEVFRAETRRALYAWRWYPVRDAKRQRVRAITQIGVTFELK
ncbi:MAG: energy transducer TonB [Myxococcales bacterium]|nr:energy transducer TonB [Myxococcales bacterium]